MSNIFILLQWSQQKFQNGAYDSHEWREKPGGLLVEIAQLLKFIIPGGQNGEANRVSFEEFQNLSRPVCIYLLTLSLDKALFERRLRSRINPSSVGAASHAQQSCVRTAMDRSRIAR